ncbi:MAG TPA: hypothetical protein VD887_07305 [Allosphingosinicella sp.]|nr:hypothetical protein [Allosphingosinicella sp.]
MRPPRRASAAAAPLIGAAGFAACELGAGLLLGRFFEWGRAEALLFFAFRPWLLVMSAALVSAWTWPGRCAFYAAALALAAAAETMLVDSLGAGEPWSEMLRGLGAGAAVALVADLAVQMGRRWRQRAGPILAASALVALLGAGAMRPYEALALGATTPRAQRGPKPPLLLMTGLPLVWGEGGAFDPDSRPSESYRMLEREYEVRPIDAIEPRTLADARLMLLAQPRLLAPEELVALDGWVRAGGSLLVLADPRLAWAREWTAGDALRPPAQSLLTPLLGHWGLTLGSERGDMFEDALGPEGGERRLVLRAPGSLVASGSQCRVSERFYLARCRLGRGQALVLADADLLDERLWVRATPRGTERHLRIADNPLIVADLLDGLAGLSRPRADRPVSWLEIPRSPAGERRALLLAALPILAALATGLALLYDRRTSPTNLSTGCGTVNNTRTEEPAAP